MKPFRVTWKACVRIILGVLLVVIIFFGCLFYEIFFADSRGRIPKRWAMSASSRHAQGQYRVWAEPETRAIFRVDDILVWHFEFVCTDTWWGYGRTVKIFALGGDSMTSKVASYRTSASRQSVKFVGPDTAVLPIISCGIEDLAIGDTVALEVSWRFLRPWLPSRNSRFEFVIDHGDPATYIWPLRGVAEGRLWILA